jgi:hemolysin activation/secretion protein
MRPELAIGNRSLARSRRGAARVAGLACAAALSAALCKPGLAQQSLPQPAQVPREIEKRFETIQFENRANRAALRLPKIAKPAVAAADTRPLFKLAGISIEGAKAISAAAIVEAYRSYIGKTVSQSDLAHIAEAISDLYRDAGYHLSRAIVPPQDIKNGRIVVRVIEGRIAELVLKGEGADQFGVRLLLAAVVDEHPSRLKTLERQLLLVNDRPGVRIVDSGLEEIGEATGKFRLIVAVETWHIYAVQSLDSLGATSVGPLQTYLASAFNSRFIAGDSLGFNLSTVPAEPRELQFGRVTYDAPVGNEGARVGVAALYSDVRPGDVRQLFDTRTQTEAAEVKGSIVPLETRNASLWLTMAAGLSEVYGRDTLGLNTYNDHLRKLSLAADYKLQDALGGSNYVSLIGRQGFDILGGSRQGDALLSRDGASGVFSVFDFSATRFQKLPDPWSMKFAVSGQLASTVLLTSEQFYIGDAAYGPGYYSGDNGLAGLMELRFDQQLPYNVLKGFQLYGFIDRAAVWNFGDAKDVLSLSSAGAGVRLYLAGQLQGGIIIAAPIHYWATANQVHGPLVLFSLTNFLKLCPDWRQLGCI